jgi:hypothetical protein
VPREQLDDLLERGMTAKRRLETARRVTGPGLDAIPLLRRVLRRADALAREEVAAAATFSPMLCKWYLTQALESQLCATQLRQALSTAVDHRPTAQTRFVLRGLWETFHASSHLTMLAAVAGAELLSQLPALAEFQKLPLSGVFVEAGISGPALRAIWASSSFGDLFLPSYESSLATASLRASVLDAALGLAAIAIRHPHLLPRVRQAFEAARESAVGDHAESAAAFAREGLRVLDEPPRLDAVRRLGASAIVSWRSLLSHDCPHRYASLDAVPDELALAAAVDGVGDMWSRPPSLVFDLLSFVARAEAEDLYLPAELALVRRSDWSPRQALCLVPSAPKPSRPAAHPDGPRRQGACPCGSGKKYKRCCETAPQRSAA